MLGFIQFILDLASKTLPAIAKNRKSGRVNQIGVELFWFYVRVNEALIQGERIISDLERFATYYPPEYVDQVWHAEIYQKKMYPHKLLSNFIIFQRIKAISYQWGPHLQVIDGESYAKLVLLFEEKENALRTLGMAAHGRLPLSFPSEIYNPIVSDPSLRDAILRELPLPIVEVIKTNRKLLQALENDCLELNSWTPESKSAVQAYLEAHNPREQLVEIRGSLEKIRAALAEAFPIGSVLP